MERTSNDPDVFIESLQPEIRDDMRQLNSLIAGILAGESRTLWEGKFWGGSEQKIIGYGDFSAGSGTRKVDWFKVGLAAQKNYISIYVNADDTDGYLVKKYEKRLGKVKVGSASIGFKSVGDIDLDVLRELIQAAKEQMS